MKSLTNTGLLALTALAITATFGVAAAFAAQFHSNAGNASIWGSQATAHKFTSGGNSITCTNVDFTGTGTPSGTSTTQDVHPEISDCTAFGFVGVTMNTTGCQYGFNADSNNVNLKSCTSGGITMHVSAFFGTTTCHVFVENQNGINKNTIPTGTASDTSVTVTTASDNIKYEVLEDKGLCPYSSKGQNGSDATYTGTTTVKANGGAATIWKE